MADDRTRWKFRCNPPTKVPLCDRLSGVCVVANAGFFQTVAKFDRKEQILQQPAGGEKMVAYIMSEM